MQGPTGAPGEPVSSFVNIIPYTVDQNLYMIKWYYAGHIWSARGKGRSWNERRSWKSSKSVNIAIV